MGTIYVDELFVLNTAIDYFLLLGTAKVCGLPFRRGRYALAAALGGLWCCLSLYPALGFLGCAAMKPVLALGMTLLAFGRERRLWRCLAAFCGISVMFGGAVFAAGLWRGSWRPGGRLLRLDMRVLLLSFALCWAGVSLLFRRRLKEAERRVREVCLCRAGRAVRFRALEDTGNGLFDPLTGRGVLVAEAEALAGAFLPEEAKNLALPAVEALERVPGARLLPYRGVGGSGGLLLCFRPERLTVDGEERDDLVAAVSPTRLSSDGSYQAVL